MGKYEQQRDEQLARVDHAKKLSDKTVSAIMPGSRNAGMNALLMGQEVKWHRREAMRSIREEGEGPWGLLMLG